MVYADLKNKTAVVTGGSKGIGTAISERFGKEGMNVVTLTTTQTKKARKLPPTPLRKTAATQSSSKPTSATRTAPRSWWTPLLKTSAA
jgi:NAD(P)-dependent dehydrogenase (short-subunit alcohol dehydrogenase family)